MTLANAVALMERADVDALGVALRRAKAKGTGAPPPPPPPPAMTTRAVRADAVVDHRDLFAPVAAAVAART